MKRAGQWFDEICLSIGGDNNLHSNSLKCKRHNVRYTPSAKSASKCITKKSNENKSPKFIVNGNWAPPPEIWQSQILNAYIVNSDEFYKFINLIETDSVLINFLEFDKSYKYADKYLIAMIFVYFKRCNLPLHEYTRLNFFCCLYLAHDIEEDDEDLKYEIFPWALGRIWRNKISSFLRHKELLWAKMNYRALVTPKCCEAIISLMIGHPVWKRERCAHLGGAKRTYLKTPLSNMPKGPKSTSIFCNTCKLEKKSIVNCLSKRKKEFNSEQKNNYQSTDEDCWLSQVTYTSDCPLNFTLDKSDEVILIGEE